MKIENKKIFFNPQEIIKYNCLINMIYGARGIGKTYGMLKYAIENFYKTGEGVIYCRRYKDEFRDFGSILAPIIANNPEYEKITYNSRKKTFEDENKKVIIKGIPLSQAVIKKSSSYSNITTIIFDEFIIDKGNYQYIPDEFSAFHNLIETVARMRELTDNQIVKVFMLANSASRNNPYFIGYKIPITKKNPYIKNDLLLYKAENQNFIEEKLKTRWGQFIKNNTNMLDYMINGDFIDKMDFIVKKLPSKTYYIATLIYLKTKIGVYKDNQKNLLYISNKINNNYKLCFSLTKADDTPDILNINANKKLIEIIKQYYNQGMLRFTDLKLQAIFIDILKII